MNPLEAAAHSILQTPVAVRRQAERASRRDAAQAAAHERAEDAMTDLAVGKADASGQTQDVPHAPKRSPVDELDEDHVDVTA